jgi:demethylmenaquinone methyltransferase/2-methoxy-6-polyprenyl-1,4-benzoquinol methylase
MLAPFYDHLIKPRERDRFLELVNLPVKGTLLDAGGGTGRAAQVFKGLASEIVVADLSYAMLQQAIGKGALAAVCTQIERLPFPTGFFDRAIMVDALHHVLDQQTVANELWRTVKPGGRIVIEEPDISKASVKLIALAEKIAFMRSHFLPPSKIRGLFAEYGTKMQVIQEDYTAWIIVDKL